MVENIPQIKLSKIEYLRSSQPNNNNVKKTKHLFFTIEITFKRFPRSSMHVIYREILIIYRSV